MRRSRFCGAEPGDIVIANRRTNCEMRWIVTTVITGHRIASPLSLIDKHRPRLTLRFGLWFEGRTPGVAKTLQLDDVICRGRHVLRGRRMRLEVEVRVRSDGSLASRRGTLGVSAW